MLDSGVAIDNFIYSVFDKICSKFFKGLIDICLFFNDYLNK